MTLLIVLFSLSVALVVFLLCYGLLQQKVRPSVSIQQRMDAIRFGGTRQAQPEKKRTGAARALKDIPFYERVVVPFGARLENFFLSFLPVTWAHFVQKQIVLAGKQREMKTGQVIAASVLGAVLMAFLFFYLLRDSDYATLQKTMFVLLGAVAGGGMPLFFLHITIQRRQTAILRQLPEVLDLLCVSVQAGLSFDGSLSKITGRMKGPLIEEFIRFQSDTRMGIVRRTALKNLAARCEVQEVSLFVTALIQAERLGTSMAHTLKSQADNMRERRKQYVKAQAMKAPVKIIFPLVLFIFPVLFLVTLVPRLLFLMNAMHK